MLTNKGKYGLKAAVYLAGIGPDELALVGDIAAANDIPRRFLDNILAELRNAGIVCSKKGRGGGYWLARSPDDIKIGDIIRVLDGPVAPIRCASKNFYERCDDCPNEKRCPVFLVMTQVREAMAQVLDHRSLSEVRDAAMLDA